MSVIAGRGRGAQRKEETGDAVGGWDIWAPIFQNHKDPGDNRRGGKVRAGDEKKEIGAISDAPDH